jgi:hypothetical protein
MLAHLQAHTYLHEVLSESSRARSKKRCWLKLLSLGTYTAIPSFLPLFESTVKSFYLLSSTACDSLWVSGAVSKCRPFGFVFSLGNETKSQGLSPASREDGNDNHVVIHKLWGFHWRVGGCVVMKEPVVVVPNFWSFLSHIFPQASQNITVKVRVDCSVRRNRFTVNNPLELWTCRAFFALGDCGLFHCDDCCFVSG